MNIKYAFVETCLGKILVVARGNLLLRVCVEGQKNFPRIQDSWFYEPHDHIFVVFSTAN